MFSLTNLSVTKVIKFSLQVNELNMHVECWRSRDREVWQREVTRRKTRSNAVFFLPKILHVIDLVAAQ